MLTGVAFRFLKFKKILKVLHFLWIRYLLRQSQPSVQVSQELDVVFTEYAEDHPMLAGDLTDMGLPTGIKVSLKAKLCLRMANVGYIPDTNLEKIQVLKLLCVYDRIIENKIKNQLFYWRRMCAKNIHDYSNSRSLFIALLWQFTSCGKSV